jgi:hypothetical protein
MRSFALVALLVLGGVACGSSSSASAQGVESWNKECRKLLKQYPSKPRHKAFATSNPNSGSGSGQACGMAWSAGSKKQAETDAIKVCMSERHTGTCWVTRSE